MLFMCIIYIICVFIDALSMKKNNIDIFENENFILLLIIPSTFPLSLFVFLWSSSVVYEFYNKKEFALLRIFLHFFIRFYCIYNILYKKKNISIYFKRE